MTNYELIQMLAEYPPNTGVIFEVGPFSGYDCNFHLHEYKDCPTLSPKLYITIEE